MLFSNRFWFYIWHEIHSQGKKYLCKCGQVDRVLDSRSGLGFDSHCWSCVEVSGKHRNAHCLGPPSRTGYLVHRPKVGSIDAGHCQGK